MVFLVILSVSVTLASLEIVKCAAAPVGMPGQSSCAL